MLIWLARRIGQAALVVLAMTIIVFLAVNVIGNPVDVMISPNADQADRLRAIHDLGLDQPLWRQYLAFLTGAAHGDLGRSFVYNVPALQLILQHMPATMELAVAAVLLSAVLGIPLGLYAGLRPRALLARAVIAGSVLGFSLPTFWVGLMMIVLFSVLLGWLPSSGRGRTAELFGVQWSFLTVDGLRHMALPALNLALFNISMVLRLTRAGVREVLPLDYVKFARVKGLSPARIVGVHVMRNILIPLVTVLGLEFGTTVAFAVVTETVWAYYARVARASALAERRREYIEAAEGLALPRARIVFRHLLPNCLPPLIVVATMQVARAITLEATLSFLGIGVPITEPSLGLLIANGYQYVLSGQYWISFYPGVALLITIVSITLIGDRARDVLNRRAER